MRKLGAAENHFSTTTSGQKAFICNFRHLNNHRYNISHGFGWLMGVPTNFCPTHYGSLVKEEKKSGKQRLAYNWRRVALRGTAFLP